jgi:hypothetical protein
MPTEATATAVTARVEAAATRTGVATASGETAEAVFDTVVETVRTARGMAAADRRRIRMTTAPTPMVVTIRRSAARARDTRARALSSLIPARRATSA